MRDAWEDLCVRTRELADLRGVSSLLEWDQQVHMPPGGAPYRAAAQAHLAQLLHDRVTNPALSDLVDRATVTDDPNRLAALRLLRRTIDRAVRVPSDLVVASSKAQTHAFHAWLSARQDDDYASFAPTLAEVVSLQRQTAAAIDDAAHPYDVLLEPYESTASLTQLRGLFARLVQGLQPLVDAAKDRPLPDPLLGDYDLDAQRRLHDEVVAAMGYDSERGSSLGFSAHPFTVKIAPGDVRITTRLHADDVLGGLGGTIHECGHALYEQGLPREPRGTGVDEAASIGMHESQSRFWENAIGRSLPFARWLAPRIAHHVGARLSPDALYRAANTIRPTPIRVYADEATYDLHIAVRFELEVALLTGDLSVRDLPGAWNEAYERVLGIVPESDAQGCLQDVHWATGAFAYFPTYTIGNLIAASLTRGMEAALPDLWSHVERGEFAPILAWLRPHVHARGHSAETPQIVRDAVGDRDGVSDLLDHLWGRHGALYGLTRPES